MTSGDLTTRDAIVLKHRGADGTDAPQSARRAAAPLHASPRRRAALPSIDRISDAAELKIPSRMQATIHSLAVAESRALAP